MNSFFRFLILSLVSSAVLGLSLKSPQVTTGATPNPVSVQLYYESLCPGCRAFITEQLYSTWKTLESSGILRVELFPYGNARESQNPDGSWKFQCQHGAPECTGNLIEACILDRAKGVSKLYFPAVQCMEEADDPIKAAQKCVEKSSKFKWEDIDACAKGPEGNKLLHVIGKATDALNPSHNYVPWIVVNGQHTDDLQRQAQTNLLGLACKLYKGPKPSVCKQKENLNLSGKEAEKSFLYDQVHIDVV